MCYCFSVTWKVVLFHKYISRRAFMPENLGWCLGWAKAAVQPEVQRNDFVSRFHLSHPTAAKVNSRFVVVVTDRVGVDVSGLSARTTEFCLRVICSRSVWSANSASILPVSVCSMATRRPSHSKSLCQSSILKNHRCLIISFLIYIYTVFRKNPLTFSIITPAFLGRFLYFLYWKEQWIPYNLLT